MKIMQEKEMTTGKQDKAVITANAPEAQKQRLSAYAGGMRRIVAEMKEKED